MSFTLSAAISSPLFTKVQHTLPACAAIIFSPARSRDVASPGESSRRRLRGHLDQEAGVLGPQAAGSSYAASGPRRAGEAPKVLPERLLLSRPLLPDSTRPPVKGSTPSVDHKVAGWSSNLCRLPSRRQHEWPRWPPARGTETSARLPRIR